VSTNANPWDTSTPGVKEYVDAIDQFAKGLREQPGYGINEFYAWEGGKLFEAAAKAAKLTPTSTPDDVRKGLYALKDETLDGGSPPLTFAKGKPAFPACYFTVKIAGGKFTSLDGDKPACLSQQQVTGLVASLKQGA
jgi:branched-chain amino acid transport system substrate-binding protein